MAATAGQVRDSPGRLVVTAAVPLFVFHGGYDPIALANELAGENAQLLVRIKGDRVFYADPPSRAPGGKGRPRRHGTRFDCKKPVTWGPRAEQLAACDDSYGMVTVAAWGRAASPARGPRPLGRSGPAADCARLGDPR